MKDEKELLQDLEEQIANYTAQADRICTSLASLNVRKEDAYKKVRCVTHHEDIINRQRSTNFLENFCISVIIATEI